jgi:hypothetical protein
MTREPFAGRVLAVKPRIGLLRSFDEISHSYKGYVLVLDGLRVAIGPAAHAKNAFRPGDEIQGEGEEPLYPEQEWADLYKIRKLKLLARGPASEDRDADIDGGVPPSLEHYRELGHRRLDVRTYERSCTTCCFGAVMPTEIILNKWKPDRVKWRVETHCYGPHDCPRYRAGKPRSVPTSTPGLVFIDDDVERMAEDANWLGAD